MLPRARTTASAFTLIELLVVIGIIGLLIAILLPALQRVRKQTRATICQTRLRSISQAWHMYSDQNGDISPPHKPASEPGGTSNPVNWYDIGNGMKYRPSWIATMGRQYRSFPFDSGDLSLAQAGSGSEPADRLNFAHALYLCPEAPDWTDERNAAAGYNYQFLGNARKKFGRYVNFPVNRSRISAFSGTVLAADSMGTAAGFDQTLRKAYQNNGTDYDALGNHSYTLDPPRLTPESDKGTGDAGSPRTVVDGRHYNKVSTVFCDSHAEIMSPQALGYRADSHGTWFDSGPGDNPAHNRFFSGTGRDDDPPPLPTQ
ncbi:MAG TPA: prepilin-type N-terminal cleavage/methylation domain-containing protein [Phycisphaerae bacterium]|jgi:prepilin-type N-terminal cleavage/methylation domain-containing protein